jgi:hypothetical protein
MFELPPDPPRLRMILDFLDDQVARNQAIGIYLSVQQQAVQRALSVAEAQIAAARPPLRPHRSAAPGNPVTGIAPNLREGGVRGFTIEQRRTPNGPEEATVHAEDCTMASDRTHRVSTHGARLALTDAQLEACAFCRPDTELGLFD